VITFSEYKLFILIYKMLFNSKIEVRNVSINTSNTSFSSRGSRSDHFEDISIVKKNKTIGLKAFPLSKFANEIKALSPTKKDIDKSKGRLIISPVKINRSKFSDQNLRFSSYEENSNSNPSRNKKNLLPPIKPINLNNKYSNSPKSPLKGRLPMNDSFINFSLEQNDSRYEMLTNQAYNSDISIENLNLFYRDYEPSKCSTKSNGNIKAYSVNTYHGICRNYNEDRVAIVLNISKPDGYIGYWPKCNFYGLYDGHGGSICADFLRDKLHEYIIKDINFPENPIQALKRGFQNAEEFFLNLIALDKKGQLKDVSGSCALVCLIIDNICYVANSGDSRAICSVNGGKSIKAITNDHKPNVETEKKRIVSNGGRVYK
jgi:hypothetical protein